jgi:hypothetical protein
MAILDSSVDVGSALNSTRDALEALETLEEDILATLL